MEIKKNLVCCQKIADSLKKQQIEGKFCDTLIIPDENDKFITQSETERLYAHSCILSASSPVLYEEICRAKNQAQNCSNGMIAVCLQSVGYKHWKHLLSYIYLGKLKFDDEEPCEFVQTILSILLSLQILTKQDFRDILGFKKQKIIDEVSLDNVCVHVRWDENAAPLSEYSVLQDDNTSETQNIKDISNRLCEVNLDINDIQSKLSFQDASSQTESDKCGTKPPDTAEIEDSSDSSVILRKSNSVCSNETSSLGSKHLSKTTVDSTLNQQETLKLTISGKTKIADKLLLCMHCNKSLQFSKMGSLKKCTRKVKNPTCDQCKLKRQRRSTLMSKRSLQINKIEQSNKLDTGHFHKCVGCGAKLKRYKSFLRHQTSCMLKPSDVMMQLQQEETSVFDDSLANHETDNNENSEECKQLLLEEHQVKHENIPCSFDDVENSNIPQYNELKSDSEEINNDHKLNLVSSLPDSPGKNMVLEGADSDDSNSTILTELKEQIEELKMEKESRCSSETEGGQEPVDESIESEEDFIETKNKPYLQKRRRKRNLQIALKYKKKKSMQSVTSLIKRIRRKPKVKSEASEETSLKKRMTYKSVESYNICNLCGDTFEDSSKEKLVKHKKTECRVGTQKGYVTGPRRVCPICFKQLSSTYKLNFHLKVVHLGEHPYECSMCPAKFKYRNAHRDHLMMVHEVDLIECGCCDKKFNSIEKYSRHKTLGKVDKGETTQAVFVCEVCGETFIDRASYRTHRLFHLSADEWKHKCHLCKKTFPQKVDRDRHIMIHTGEKPFLCDICSYSTNRKYNLKLHQRKHEAERSGSVSNTASADAPSQLTYSCKTCKEQFKLKTELKAHLKIHDSKKVNCIMKKRVREQSRAKKSNNKKSNRPPSKKKARKSEVDESNDVKSPELSSNVQAFHSEEELPTSAKLPEHSAHDETTGEFTSTVKEMAVKPGSYENIVLSVPSSKLCSTVSGVGDYPQTVRDTGSTGHPNATVVHSAAAGSAAYYSERYQHHEKTNVDAQYGSSNIDLYPSNLQYRGPGFVPLATARGVENWNFSSKENTVSSIEEAFRIIGMPTLVPVSAVDLSTTSTNTFTQPSTSHVSTNAQLSSQLVNMMSNAFNQSQQSSYEANP